MAAPAITKNTQLTGFPWLIRELIITSGNTATALAHNGPAVKPDMLILRNATSNPTGSDASCYAATTTHITFDFEDDGNEVWVCYAFWLSQAGGGITVPS